MNKFIEISSDVAVTDELNTQQQLTLHVNGNYVTLSLTEAYALFSHLYDVLDVRPYTVVAIGNPAHSSLIVVRDELHFEHAMRQLGHVPSDDSSSGDAVMPA